MPRTREFNPEEALEKALALFWEKGYGDTSFDDLVATTQVSRYGLYDSFGGKRDLFRAALRSYLDRFRDRYQATLRTSDASLAEIRDYFEGLIQLGQGEAANRGCLVCNSAVEMAQSDPEIGADIRAFFKEMVDMFRSALRNARDKGELRGGVNIDDWAVHLVALNQSASVMARLGLEPKLIRSNIEASLSALELE